MRGRWVILVPLVLSACSGPGPKVVEGRFDGPDLSIDSSGTRHIAMLSAPSAGWTIALDRTIRQFDDTEVYVSITRPNPAYMHAQVISTHRLDTSVESGRPIGLFARTLDFGQAGNRVPYRVVSLPAPAVR